MNALAQHLLVVDLVNNHVAVDKGKLLCCFRRLMLLVDGGQFDGDTCGVDALHNETSAEGTVTVALSAGAVEFGVAPRG